MESNRKAVLTIDFLKTWFKAFRNNPVVMLKITIVAILALAAMMVVRVFRRASNTRS